MHFECFALLASRAAISTGTWTLGTEMGCSKLTWALNARHTGF